MALCEDTGPLTRPLFTIDSGSAVATLIRRSAAWANEASGLTRGLCELAWPLRWYFAAIFGFNLGIAIWETVQPFILAWGVDTFEARVPYLEVAAVIVLPVLAISLPQGILLPFARDLYAAWFVKPQYEKRVGMLCLEQNRSRTSWSELSGKKAPIAQDGRLAAYQLTEMLLRDPAFAARGVVVLGILLFKSPLLVGILVVGMVADLVVTMLMDARLSTPYAVLREHQFRLRGLEYQLLDGGSGERDGESESTYERVGCLHPGDALRRAAPARLPAADPRRHLNRDPDRRDADGRLVGAHRRGVDRRLYPVYVARRPRQRSSGRLPRLPAADHDHARIAPPPRPPLRHSFRHRAAVPGVGRPLLRRTCRRAPTRPLARRDDREIAADDLVEPQPSADLP